MSKTKHVTFDDDDVFEFGQISSAGTFRFEMFWTAVKSKFDIVSKSDVKLVIANSNQLRQRIKAQMNMEKKYVAVRIAPTNKTSEILQIMCTPAPEPDQFTYRRFMACYIMRAIELRVEDVMNPLAERAGFEKKASLPLYCLFAPGGEFLFFRFPSEVTALCLFRKVRAKELGIVLASEDEAYRTLVRQKTGEKELISATDWLKDEKNAQTVREKFQILVENCTGMKSAIKDRMAEMDELLNKIMANF